MADTSKPAGRWYQYSLRTLMIFVLLAGLGFGLLGRRIQQARRQRTAVLELIAVGASVKYDHELSKKAPPGPRWVRGILGDDVFTKVTLVRLPRQSWLEVFGKMTDAELVYLEGITDVSTLPMTTPITDADLEHLRELIWLEHLDLNDTQVTDAELEHLKKLTSLRTLALIGTQVTDEGVAELQQALPNCKITH